MPTLVARGPTGQVLEAYFNIWGWILPKLTPAERGTKRGEPKARGHPEMGAYADRDFVGHVG